MPDKVLYTAEATSTGDGRNGHVATSDGRVDLDLAFPPELGGTGAGANPEQLFAAGYSACFEGALRLVARLQKKALTDAHITAHVTLNQTDDKRYALSVELHGKLDGMSHEDAAALMHAAHEVCPYSRATRGNIEVKLVVD